MASTDNFPAQNSLACTGTGNHYFPPVARTKPDRGYPVLLPPLGRTVDPALCHALFRCQPFAAPVPSPALPVPVGPAALSRKPCVAALVRIRDWRSSGE